MLEYDSAGVIFITVTVRVSGAGCIAHTAVP